MATFVTQAHKAEALRALHAQPGTFIIPNPWDVGSARLLALAGFRALASSSSGYAYSRGIADNRVGRERMLAHLAELAAATDLPISADLENGFGDAPETVAETIRLAAQAGVVGGSIEDGTGRADAPIYTHAAAVERVRAAAEAARALPFPFTLTARCENFLAGRPDLDDTIARLVAYRDAGADVLYAPGLSELAEVDAVVRAVGKPVNVLIRPKNPAFNLANLAGLGVKRISVGGALARTAFGALVRGIDEMRERGTFSFAAEPFASGDFDGWFSESEPFPRHFK
ncbi:isocitrate lyase/PEP mutase family protein [Burkholderia alba]|uniref:isocitrate lyase/PEP mutase family protein n=1 Tax=Burkholderia alba TaxID=2683677 RepID=UPI002B05B741|nr:isocitrate lyase/phosphoenolpyruvate mutase family protein [Burkholderia alba]